VACIIHGAASSVYITRAAGHRGVRFSKVVSYGNAVDVNECDLSGVFFARDDETKIVAVYIEGVRTARASIEQSQNWPRQSPSSC